VGHPLDVLLEILASDFADGLVTASDLLPELEIALSAEKTFLQ